VFGSAPEERYIPWALADVSQRRESPLADLLPRLLELPDSRFTASDILALVEIPGVQRRLGVGEADLPLLRRWITDAGVRWGRDAEARRRLGQEDGELNTWRHGFRRLFFGYALPDQVERFGETAPVAGLEGGGLRLLGSLKSFVDRLERLADLFNRSHPPADWQVHLLCALDELLDAGDEEPALDHIRSALQGMAEGAARAGMQEPLRREVVKALMQSELDSGGAQHRYAGGRVTFCAMVPMRAVPFRVVALLGLNDSDYPRRQRPLGFDLMAGDRRPGDRSVREEDRHLFLEALLSARDYLILSYLGADARDSSELEPALMLSELRDYIDGGFVLERPLTIQYPLQPFSPRYRRADSELLSYAAEWLLEPDAVQPAEAFCEAELAAPEEVTETLELDELIRFFRQPAEYFLRRRLGVRIGWDEAPVEDDEPFQMAGLDQYRLRGDLLEAGIAGQDLTNRLELHRLRGELPRGGFAELALGPDLVQVQTLAALLEDERQAPLPALELDLSLHRLRLQGWLRGLDQDGVLQYRAGKFGGRELVELWLRHLALNALEDPVLPRASRHLSLDGQHHLGPLTDPAEARALLAELVALYLQGQCRPLRFFPRASLAYCEQLRKKDDVAAALEKARKNWLGNPDYGQFGESQDEPNIIAFRGLDPLDGEFSELAKCILGPALDRLES